MREIEFRGKYPSEDLYDEELRLAGKWHYGLPQLDRTFWYIDNPEDTYRAIPETIEQYIGLKDKNEVKIFEGDIVKDNSGKIGYIAYLQQEMGFVIVYPKHDIRLGHRNTGSGYAIDIYLEVIGNIHDNPELLEMQDK